MEGVSQKSTTNRCLIRLCFTLDVFQWEFCYARKEISLTFLHEPSIVQWNALPSYKKEIEENNILGAQPTAPDSLTLTST